MAKNLYFVKGFYYNKKLDIWQIIDEGLFADSEMAAEFEALNFFKKISNGKAKIYSVEPCPNETYEEVF